jgi:hypothetical protein
VDGLARFGPFGPAEQRLIDGVGTGTLDRVGGLPDLANEASHIRAALIRFLVLGGADAPRMHEKGLRLSGACVIGVLDLEGCRVPRDIGLLDCLFDSTPVLRSAVIDTLSLDGSDLPGLDADRLDARGDVLFRSATLRGKVQLRGARIGGDMVFDAATLDCPDDLALRAERIAIRGSVLFRGASVRGGIALPGGRIGGDLDLIGAEISHPEGVALDAASAQIEGDLTLRLAQARGEVSLVSARIGGDIDLTGARISRAGEIAVNLARSTAKGALFLRDGARIDGVLSLNGSNVAAIVDEPACWPDKGNLWLNRCEYGAFLGGALGAEERLAWLARQTPDRWGDDFWPQPYEQLAQVYGDMGHDEERRRVLMEKERLSRRARRHRMSNPAMRALLWLKDMIIAMTTGYGRLPLLAIIWIGLLWAAGAGIYTWLDGQNAMRPNAAVVLRSPEWVLCAVPHGARATLASVGAARDGLARPGEAQLACYRRQPEAAAYPKFNAIMLSVDAIVPGLGNGQGAYWSPDTRSTKGYAGKWFMYFQTVAGFALGLLAVAGFSGIVKSN